MKYLRFVITPASLAIIGIAALSDHGMSSVKSAFADQTTISANQAQSAQAAMVSRHIIFSGKVQGVGFRNKARSIATGRQLTGYVRNLADGTVEMIVQGKAQDVDDCLKNIKEFFKKNIKEAKISNVDYESKYTDFKVLY
jgi:acylphosphatase